MKTLSEIKKIKDSIEKELLKRKGVTGVDIQEKEVNGKKTGELSIQIYVEKKKPVKSLKKSDLIPKTINGVKTDVKEEEFFAHYEKMSLADFRAKVDATKYATLQGGMSIGPCRAINNFIFVGTLGCIVTDNVSGQEMMLSNFHVMSVDNNWSPGDTLAQPARNDGGTCATDVVGTLQRSILNADIDGAVANISGRPYNCEVLDIGELNGTNVASNNMAVRKRGRTTELTYGTVTSTNLSVNIPYGQGVGNQVLTNQIRIEVDAAQNAQFGIGGDSGSVVVDENNNVIGLYFAGNNAGTVGVANPISDVLTQLDIDIYQCPKKIEIKETGKEFGKHEFKEGGKEFGKVEIKEFGKLEFKEGGKEFGKSEIKEFAKIEKLEKEKIEKPETKEFKEKDFEDPKHLVEGPGGLAPPRFPFNSNSYLESMRQHFINQSQRPNLNKGALRNEKDC